MIRRAGLARAPGVRRGRGGRAGDRRRSGGAGRCWLVRSDSPTGELSDLQNGQVVRHGLPPQAPGEIAVAGAVRIRAPKAAFFARVRDIARFKSGEEMLQIGRFSDPPALEDLATLTVGPDDFDVRSCRVGDCGIRLPAATIERFGREIDPKAADAQARGAQLFKQVLLDEVTAYVSGAGSHGAVRRWTEADPVTGGVRRDPRRHAGD